jgi:hypothetical protein
LSLSENSAKDLLSLFSINKSGCFAALSMTGPLFLTLLRSEDPRDPPGLSHSARQWTSRVDDSGIDLLDRRGDVFRVLLGVFRINRNARKPINDVNGSGAGFGTVGDLAAAR